MIQIIAGIGNPDPEYKNTYHNIGILAVEYLMEEYAEDAQNATWQEYKNLFSYRKAGDLIFVRSRCYMNESGRAIAGAARFFGVPPERVTVIHDESDLAVGSFRFAEGGSSAGHKGIQSIIDHFGTPDFPRIRIGIRNLHEVRRKKAE